MKRVLLAMMVLLVGTSDVEARKPRPAPKKSRPVAPRKPRRGPVSTEAAENALHQERLAVLGRLKEVNAELKDGELAAILERIKQKETQRHQLARQLIKKEQDAKDEDAK